MIKLNKSTIFHSCTCTLYICEYNQWSIVSGIERAPVALSRSVHVQFTATRKHCSKKKCTCVVHRGFPND